MGKLVTPDFRELCETVNEIKYPKEGFFRHILRGDAMSPTLPGGSVCLIDTTDRQIVDGELYCLNYPIEGHVVRRLSTDGNMLVTTSDNPLSPTYRTQIDEIKTQSLIVGRIKTTITLF